MSERTEIRCLADEEAVSRAGADLFGQLARRAVECRGRFMVALSGGSTPRRMFHHLAGDSFRDKVPWQQIEFLWGDERAVPPDHPDSNYRMAREAMLAKVPVPAERVHRMPADSGDLELAALEYEATIARLFGISPDGQPPALDLVLLGMGTDGHTASLFPHTQALEPGDRWVVPNLIPELETHRLTLTAEIINHAACVLFLVKGADKAQRLAEVLEGPSDPDRLPSQLIRPSPGRLIWLVDRAAAANLRDDGRNRSGNES
jgi:6-phosphogluconolactonase